VAAFMAALAERISARTYYAAAARGEVPARRIGRRLVVPGAALARFMEGGIETSDDDANHNAGAARRA
jgi:hypothetical protein